MANFSEVYEGLLNLVICLHTLRLFLNHQNHKISETLLPQSQVAAYKRVFALLK